MRVGVKDGAVILESEQVDLKITPDREVWVRKGHPVVYGNMIRWEKNINYKSIGRKLDRGHTREEKQIFLIKLRAAMLQKIKLPSRNSQEEEHEDSYHEEKTEDSESDDVEVEIHEDDEEEQEAPERDEDEERHK